jgi:lactoylglutathione lyase
MTTIPPPHTPSHFGICVSDIERSVRFYCGGLGFARAEQYELTSDQAPGLDRSLEVAGLVGMASQFIHNAGMRIELLTFTTPAATGTPSHHRNQLGLTHLSFFVDDVDAAAQRLVEFGGTILPDTRSNPGIEIVFLADPDGVRIELMALP